MTEGNVVEVPCEKDHLLESILNPDNLNNAYKAVVKNQGCGGIDDMSCGQPKENCKIRRRAIPNILLKRAGYPCLTDLYLEWIRK